MFYFLAYTFTHYVLYWKDALEAVINSRKLPDIVADTSTQKKHYK